MWKFRDRYYIKMLCITRQVQGILSKTIAIFGWDISSIKVSLESGVSWQVDKKIRNWRLTLKNRMTTGLVTELILCSNAIYIILPQHSLCSICEWRFLLFHQGGLVWSPYAAEDSMDALYPDLAQVSYCLRELVPEHKQPRNNLLSVDCCCVRVGVGAQLLRY